MFQQFYRRTSCPTSVVNNKRAIRYVVGCYFNQLVNRIFVPTNGPISIPILVKGPVIRLPVFDFFFAKPNRLPRLCPWPGTDYLFATITNVDGNHAATRLISRTLFRGSQGVNK